MTASCARFRTLIGVAGQDNKRYGAALEPQLYSVSDLREELRRFEHELRAAGLKENSVDGTAQFLKLLDGDYRPRGPN